MLKLPRGRIGKEARTFWAFAGCVFPEDLDGFALQFERDGAWLEKGEGLELKKGINLVGLPSPKLTYVTLNVTPSTQLLVHPGITGVMGGGMYSAHSIHEDGLVLKITCKEDVLVTGPIVHLFLQGDRV